MALPKEQGSRCVHNVAGGCMACRSTVASIKAVAKEATTKAQKEGFTARRAA